MEYRVIWEIDIEAKNPREAAKKAKEIQRRVNDANVFSVKSHKYNGGIGKKVTTIDLGYNK
jgi:hypothetical protein